MAHRIAILEGYSALPFSGHGRRPRKKRRGGKLTAHNVKFGRVAKSCAKQHGGGSKNRPYLDCIKSGMKKKNR